MNEPQNKNLVTETYCVSCMMEYILGNETFYPYADVNVENSVRPTCTLCKTVLYGDHFVSEKQNGITVYVKKYSW
jgi:hypothetical protein